MENNEKKILFIVCFFGQIPWFFKFFLKSAAYNPTIDFLLVTDDLKDIDFPSNFKTLTMSMKELESMAQSKLQCKVTLDFPYKICDIRPAYGVIFEDYLREYDFWGYCDVDVIFGNIREFATTKTLNRYDVLSARPEFLPGYFALYKNVKKINELFKRSKDYIEVFKDTRYLNFDECSSNHEDLFHGKRPGELDFKIESMTYLLKIKCKNEGIRTLFDLMAIDWAIGKMHWNQGVLTYDNKFQLLLYHLIEYKRTGTCIVPDWAVVPDQFYINESSFSYTELCV